MTAWIMRLALCVGLAVSSTGCYTVLHTNYERPIPTDEAIDSIVPGVSTRVELVKLFGPPMEDHRPTISDRGRAVIPGLRQVYTEYDLLDRRIAVWEHEVRRDTIFMIPFIFSHRRVIHETDRLFVSFDEHGVVEVVGHARQVKP